MGIIFHFCKMRKTHEKLRSEVSMDKLVDNIRQKLLSLPDPRNRTISLPFHDLVMSGFAMFNLKYPSMHRFENQTESERKNLKNLFKIENLCSDAALKNNLDQIDPSSLRDLYAENLNLLKKTGVLKEYRTRDGYLIASVDGVQHFSSKKIHCDNCLCRKHKNGETTYHHSMLCAALVNPYQREVFIIGSEPIVKQDGEQKNDCERNAAKRLFSWFSDNYKDEKFIFVEDALYANGPHLKQILKNQWEFIVNIKPGSHKKLFTLFETRKKMKSAKFYEFTDKAGTIHRFWYDNNLPLNGTATDLRIGVLMYEETKKNGKVQKFSWATSFNLTKRNVEKIMKIGRSRWKIENETFNTLKNQGYHFDHNYGHGFQHLSTFLAYLMLLAFQTDQIFQRCNSLFNRIWNKAKTKAKLWEVLRSVFMIKIIYSFNELFETLAFQFRVQLE